jgi:superfamily II RNA helicase
MTSTFLKVVPIGSVAPAVAICRSVSGADFTPVPAATYAYPLDNFQQHAIAAISRDENVLVTAKTGSGKTLVGEYQIAHSLRAGRRVFYTTPIKSLSNQKFHDLTKGFPEARVGIMTGDIKFMPDADVVIMTTEILRNLLYKQGTATAALGLSASLSLDRLDAVVFDECHYINDRDRGRVWEETMILLPESVKLILLSATISRPDLFASWLGDLRQRPINLIQTSHRVVPLTHYAGRITAQELELVPIMSTGADHKEHFDMNAYRAYLDGKAADRRREREFKASAAGRAADVAEARAAAAAANECTVVAAPAAAGKFREASFIHQLNTLVNTLKVRDLLPALIFAFSRADTERYAAAIEGSLIDSSDSAAVKHIFDFHLRDHKELQTIDQYWTIRSLVVRGIAFHHSGVLPLLKEIVEILFGKGLLRVLCCTETFAVGINMPTRTTVFVDLKKHDDSGLRLVRTDEYIQMAGRAGRRGKDVRGHVIYLPAREPLGPSEMQQVMTGCMPQIQSRMVFGYEFILKALHAGGDRWLQIINQSFWHQQAQHTLKVFQDQAAKVIRDQATYIVANKLTEDVITAMEERDAAEVAGRTAANNQVKKEAARTLSVWENKHFGPVWVNAKKVWPGLKDLRRQETVALKAAEAQAAELEDPAALIAEPIKFLVDTGFLGGDGKTLTPKGLAATEINEGHSLMMAEAYGHRIFADLNGQEIVALLATFLAEPPKGDQFAAEIHCSAAVSTAYARIADIRERFMILESTLTEEAYWHVGADYVDLVYDWLAGTSAKEICESYCCYEANFTKIILKASNLVEEVTAIATLAADTQLLEKLQGICLVRDIVVPDSLYLRL